MEQVFPVEHGTGPGGLSAKQGFSPPEGAYKKGVVEKVLKPGNFKIVFEDGTRVEAKGSAALKVGSPVRILLAPERSKEPGSAPGDSLFKAGEAEGLQWFAVIPLAFGGVGAAARLEVFVERQKEGARNKVEPAAYFVFTVQTEENGEIQWSVHLKGRQVTLQVFAQFNEKKERLSQLVLEVAAALKKRGLVMTSPAVVLSRAFKVPAGFRLNVRG